MNLLKNVVDILPGFRIVLPVARRNAPTETEPTTTMTTNTTTTIRLRNKLTGLYYVDGGCFSANEASATIIERDSAKHIMIRHTYTMGYMQEIKVTDKSLPSASDILAVFHASNKYESASVELGAVGSARILAIKNPFKNGIGIHVVSANGESYGAGGFAKKPSEKALSAAFDYARHYAITNGIA